MRSPSERAASVISTVLLGVVLFFSGFWGVIEGDSGHSPVYHAGWMNLGSLMYLFFYFVFELILPPGRPWQAPRIQFSFLAWMLIGSIILSIVEARNPGECCANPALNQDISNFSLLWPLSFSVPTLLTTYCYRLKKKQRLELNAIEN